MWQVIYLLFRLSIRMAWCFVSWKLLSSCPILSLRALRS